MYVLSRRVFCHYSYFTLQYDNSASNEVSIIFSQKTVPEIFLSIHLVCCIAILWRYLTSGLAIKAEVAEMPVGLTIIMSSRRVDLTFPLVP